MKRIMIALLIGLVGFTYEAKAQWTVTTHPIWHKTSVT